MNNIAKADELDKICINVPCEKRLFFCNSLVKTVLMICRGNKIININNINIKLFPMVNLKNE